MITKAMSEATWTPPGPGMWERDAAHQDRPFSRLFFELAPHSFSAGTSEAFARFGLPFSGFEMADINGWFFGTLSPVAADEFPARVEAAERAVVDRPWRAIADEWYSSVRASFVRRNQQLQAVVPADLDDAALAAHLLEAIHLYSDAAKRHFFDAVAHWVAVGLLVNEAQELAGWDADRTILSLSGASPASTAPLTALRRISMSIETIPEARALLASEDDATTTIAALRATSVEVDQAIGVYLETHGWQIFTGFDFTHQAMAELPELFLETIRKVTVSSPAPENTLEELLTHVPAAGQARLRTLIDDAVVGYGLRDDDSGPTIQQPVGLVRRGLLEAGARLKDRDLILNADDIFDAASAELTPLLTGKGSCPSAIELSDRANIRRGVHDVPPRRIGDEEPEPEGPPPPAMAAILGALFTAMTLEDTEDTESESTREAHGVGASAGVYEGRACVVLTEGDFELLQEGDVLVASITTPAYNVLLPLVGAVVTDRGGILSHPAIVAREFGIPAVVGTNHATAMIQSGDRIRVDGRAGTVTILS